MEDKMDYKTMFENTFKELNERLRIEKEYFELLKNFESSSVSAGLMNAVSTKMPEMSMADQTMLLKMHTSMNELYKYLFDKYELEEEEDGDE